MEKTVDKCLHLCYQLFWLWSAEQSLLWNNYVHCNFNCVYCIIYTHSMYIHVSNYICTQRVCICMYMSHGHVHEKNDEVFL